MLNTGKFTVVRNMWTHVDDKKVSSSLRNFAMYLTPGPGAGRWGSPCN